MFFINDVSHYTFKKEPNTFSSYHSNHIQNLTFSCCIINRKYIKLALTLPYISLEFSGLCFASPFNYTTFSFNLPSKNLHIYDLIITSIPNIPWGIFTYFVFWSHMLSNACRSILWMLCESLSCLPYSGRY